MDEAVSAAPHGPGNALRSAALRDLVPLAAVLLQFALLILVMRQFSLEGSAFLRILALACIGFPIHHWLPAPARMPFFLALSLIGIFGVFGATGGGWDPAAGVLRTGALVGIGIGLVAIAHLPLARGWRVTSLLLVGAALAHLRVGHAAEPSLAPVWPVLGSMFMFRLIIYLYDLRHEKAPRASRSLAYFFLLPNVCFPLFPVVDYKTFTRSVAPDAGRLAVYQTGLRWMLRGILHLVAYRLISRHLLLDAKEVSSGVDVVRFLVANSALYLRVSGQFHLVIGLLHLFGFDLPETNRRYFLASSFTDYWRRVNVYWKDFILKIFYYPAYFRLKRLGPLPAMVLATLFSFVATWLLHSYQWFWLRGDFPIAWQDLTFWGVLALLVVGNSVYELLRGRQRTLRKPAWSWRQSASRGLRTALTFGTVSVLWSLWACASLEEWLGIWRAVDPATLSYGGAVLGAVAIAATVEEALPDRRASAGPSAAPSRSAALLPSGAWACAAAALVVYVLGLPALHARLAPELRPFAEALAGLDPNDAAAAADADRGYYEALMDVSAFNPKLWEVYTDRPVAPGDRGRLQLSRRTDDFRLVELRPSASIEFHGVVMSTNRWAMRDRDYALEKPPGVVRIAVLGSSIAMGFGVSASELFEDRLEDALNREQTGGSAIRWEVLNFAVNGYSPLAQLPVLDERVPPFQPDLVLLTAHSVDGPWTTDHIVKALRLPGGLPYPQLAALIEELGLGHDSLRIWARSRLKPREPELLAWSYREIAERSRRLGALPVFAFIALPRETEPFERSREVLATAQEAGFAVIDLSAIFRGMRSEELALSDWNAHPNRRAHQLVAEALHAELRSHPGIDLAALARRAATPAPPGASRR